MLEQGEECMEIVTAMEEFSKEIVVFKTTTYSL